MQKISIKLIIISMVCLVFFIGLMFVSSLVDERQHYHNEVINEIKTAHVAHQQLMTPFLVASSDAGDRLIFPAQSQLDMNIKVRDDEYKRGIYQAISYHGSVNAKQSFILPDSHFKTDKANQIKTKDKDPKAKDPTPKRLMLFISASDLRGVNTNKITINNKNYPAKFATDNKFGVKYLAVDVSDQLGKSTLTSDTSLSLSGIDSLSLLPLGSEFQANLSSDWHEPKFFGQALPTFKDIQNHGDGFTAMWQGGFIANQNEASLIGCAEGKDSSICPIFEQLTHTNTYQTFGTAFVKTNDTYAQTDRAIKYALLFLLISFGTFFLFETLKKLRIHPIQYGLVASALLIFYVLLLSLAEHLVFYLAYTIAASACASLIGFYTYHVLGNAKRAIGFTTLLSSLYAGFYFILSMNELNLLVGAIFCFLLLAIVMFITRNIDWYALEFSRPNQQGATHDDA